MADVSEPKWMIASGVTSLLFIGAVVLSSTTWHREPPASYPVLTAEFPGFTALSAPPPDTGIIVTSLQSSGPAERAGVRVGDDIVAIDDHRVGSIREARAILQQAQGRRVRLRRLHSDMPVDVELDPNRNGQDGA